MTKIYNSLARLGEEYSIEKIVLFGSRARGDNRERSDIDIAIYGLDKNKRVNFAYSVDELNTLLKFDIVFVDSKTEPVLIKNIEKDGVILYEQAE